MRRILVALLAGSIVFGSVYAAAASLTLSANNLGAGTEAVNRCDPDGFDFAFTLDEDDNVTAVTVSDIALACDGGELTLHLIDTNGDSAGSGTAAVDNTGSVLVPIASTPPVDSVAEQAVVIVGP